MVESARRHGKVLPQTGNVGEAQIDHLDLVVLYRLEKVFRALAHVKHLAPPFLKAWRWSRMLTRVGKALGKGTGVLTLPACVPGQKRLDSTTPAGGTARESLGRSPRVWRRLSPDQPKMVNGGAGLWP